jgi:hypothetical protein
MRLRLLAAALCIWPALVPVAAGAQGGTAPAGIRRPTSAAAHADSARRAPSASLVRGVVFDSVSNVPLVGAAVQLVRDDSTKAAQMQLTDSLGSFAFPDVPRGRYLIGFFHPAVDSLELDAPVTRVDVTGRPTVLVDLAIPSGERLLAKFCGPRSPMDSTGALVGWLRDAQTDSAIADGRVVLTWSQLMADERGLRLEQRRSPTRSRATGFFVACDLPAATALLLDADADRGRRSGLVEVQVPPRGLARLDLVLADTAAAAPVVAKGGGDSTSATTGERLLSGTARLTGIVRDDAHRPLPRAQVSVRGAAGSALTGEDGRFSLGNLPAGTRAVQVRAIGYEPRTATVTLRAGRMASTEVNLDKRVDVLAAVNVIEKQTKRTRDITGFEDRRRTGQGSYLTREDIEKRSPISMTDALRTTPGLQIAPNGNGTNSVYGRGGCKPAVYVDGMQVADGATDIDAIVRPTDVRGVEIYRSGATAPAEYGGVNGNSCGTLLIWTGR